MLTEQKVFRQIIFLIILGCVLVLSGCAASDKGEGYNYRGGYSPRAGYTSTTSHKAQVTEACWEEANNRVGLDYFADDRARRIYFSQCYLRNGYDSDGKYIGIPPK